MKQYTCFFIKVINAVVIKQVLVNNYKLHDQTLATVTSPRYLGVHISNSFSWNVHIDIIAKKATQA